MKFITSVLFLALMLSPCTAGFLKNLITGSGRRHQQEITTTTERETFRPMTQGTQSYLEDNAKKPAAINERPTNKPSSTAERETYRPMTQGTQFYLEDNAKKPVAIDEPLTKRPMTQKAQGTFSEEQAVTKPSIVAAFYEMTGTRDGGFTFSCVDSNCRLSRLRGNNKAYQLTCNDKVCQDTGKTDNYECELSQNIRIYTDLVRKRASCEAANRSIFNPQSRKACPDGQKPDRSGTCRLDF